MPINDTNTENNENVKDVLGEIDSSDVTAVSENQSPKSLLDMCIALIAQDPSLSVTLLQSDDFDAPHVTDVLRKTTPFIQLLPAELKCELIMFLPLQDWESLWHVSQEWRQIVSTSAKIFLDQMERDKLPVIQLSLNDFDPILENFLERVERYSRESRRRPEQVQEIKELALETRSLTQPIAKFMHCKKKIEKIQGAIDREYRMFHSFFGPRNSQLHTILELFLRESNNLIENSPLIKKINFCTRLYPEHATGKRLTEALLEIKGQKSPVEEKPKMDRGEEKRVSSFLHMS